MDLDISPGLPTWPIGVIDDLGWSVVAGESISVAAGETPLPMQAPAAKVSL